MKHFIRYNKVSNRVEAFSGKRPKGSDWQELQFAEDCCGFELPEVFTAFRTVTVNYQTPIGDEFRVTFIGEQGQGVFNTGTLSNSNTSDQLVLPDTGTWTIVISVLNGVAGASIIMANANLIGIPSTRPVITGKVYGGFGNSLVNTYNLLTPVI